MTWRPLSLAVSMSLMFAANVALFDVYAPVGLVLLQTAAIGITAFAAAVMWIHVAAQIVRRRY